MARLFSTQARRRDFGHINAINCILRCSIFIMDLRKVICDEFTTCLRPDRGHKVLFMRLALRSWKLRDNCNAQRWKSMKIIDFHWFFIDFHWFPLVFIDFHWFPLGFIGKYNKIQFNSCEKSWGWLQINVISTWKKSGEKSHVVYPCKIVSGIHWWWFHGVEIYQFPWYERCSRPVRTRTSISNKNYGPSLRIHIVKF